jgi:hypothetical protein
VIVGKNITLLTITNWSRRVVRKMFKGIRHNSFVCLDDVSECVEDMNYVIYNPNIEGVEIRKNRLYEKIKWRFGVELTEEQLDHLTSYGALDLEKFVQELQQIIKK